MWCAGAVGNRPCLLGACLYLLPPRHQGPDWAQLTIPLPPYHSVELITVDRIGPSSINTARQHNPINFFNRSWQIAVDWVHSFLILGSNSKSLQAMDDQNHHCVRKGCVLLLNASSSNKIALVSDPNAEKGSWHIHWIDVLWPQPLLWECNY